ncbi:MAG TPA: hypothetical protein VFG72_02520 [Marmoricola sp.]|nr:hypothetical protein [Marmoricola sp.]
MELLDVTLTPLQRRNRAAFVARQGSRDVAVGERVVLRDEHGDYFAGSVVDVDDRRLLVHLGVRLPEEYAMLRLGRRRPGAEPPGDGDDVQSVLDLIGEAREALGGRMPSQRLASDLL